MTINLPKLYKLAVCLHISQCRYNHTDQCSWDYGLSHKDKWEIGAHKSYLDKAKRVKSELNDISVDLIIRVIEAI